MSRPMALALVLLVLFLTSQSEWRAASSQSARGSSSDPRAPATMTKEARLEMHRNEIKEKIILDLIADLKHLEADNRKQQNEIRLLRTQNLQLRHALAGSSSSLLTAKLLKLRCSAGASESSAASASTSEVHSRSALLGGTSAAPALSGSSVLAEFLSPPSPSRDAVAAASDHPSSLRVATAGAAFSGQLLPLGVISESRASQNQEAALFKPRMASSQGEASQRLTKAATSSESSQVDAWAFSDSSPLTNDALQPFIAPTDKPAEKARAAGGHKPNVDGLAEDTQEESSRRMRELALDKLFRGRTGSLGTHKKIGTFPLSVEKLQGDGALLFRAPGQRRRKRTSRHKQNMPVDRGVVDGQEESAHLRGRMKPSPEQLAEAND